MINVGYADVENYWGEKLKDIRIDHTFAKLQTTYCNVMNIEHGAIEKNALSFYYSTGFLSEYDKWSIVITTMSGDTYSTSGFFQCGITSSDNGRATIGINGDAKTVYINFPSSSGCSRKLVKSTR